MNLNSFRPGLKSSVMFSVPSILLISVLMSWAIFSKVLMSLPVTLRAMGASLGGPSLNSCTVTLISLIDSKVLRSSSATS